MNTMNTDEWNGKKFEVEIIDWRGQPSAEPIRKAFEEIGIDPGRNILKGEDLLEVVRDLLLAGINVMMSPRDGGYLLAVDTYLFQTRG